jgi:formamidopyrimidine-DNA glycosylase
MPELPEVETLRRQIAPVLTGARLVQITTHPHPKYAGAAQAAGAAVTAVTRRGKYLLCVLDDGRELLIHLGMTGQVWLREPADHVKVTLVTDRGTLWFRDPRGFGRVTVVTVGEYTAHPTLHHLGPDPLDAGFDVAAAGERLAGQRGPVKQRLLDQRAFAGTGNYIADEALWRVGVHPGVREIDVETAQRLVAACVAVMHESLEQEGMSERDYQHLDGGTGTYQLSLDAYGRAGMACRRCATVMVKTVVAGRGTTFCPECQR